NMSSEGAMPAAGPRLHHLTTWFDPESAAVVTILLGLFQVLLSVPLAYSEQNLPKIFFLPLVIGILVMAGGSFTLANERNPSRQLLKGCACSNVAGLLGALIAFCLYCYSLNTAQNKDPCIPISSHDDFSPSPSFCPGEILMTYSWSVTLLLLLHDIGAMIMHSLLSLSALKALKTD
ncbi:hypothetical protein L3Q82_019266, partial [Scortum barcoo]